MPNLVISPAHTGRLAEATAGRRHRGKLCSVNLWTALAVPNDVCRWHLGDVPARRNDVRFSNRPFGVKRFQTIHPLSVDVAHGLVLLFGIGTRGPSIMGFEDEAEQSLPRPCREIRPTQADMRTHLIHRPARDIIPPLSGTRVSSYRI